MEVKGKIIRIGGTKEFGSNGFTKREVVVKTEEQYPQKLLIEFIQENCSMLDSYKIEDNVEINIEIRGREWISPEGKTRYFNSFIGNTN